MTHLELTIIALFATYRLTQLLNNESGPRDIFVRLRSRLGVKFDEYSNPYGTTWVADAILCFYCLSIWVALGVSGLLIIAQALNVLPFAVGILFPFALSGGAVYLKKQAG